MNKITKQKIEIAALEKEIGIIDYINLIISNESKFESIALYFFTQDLLKKNPELKDEIARALKESRTELIKRANNKRGLVEIYEKIQSLPKEKKCPDCKSTMYLKPVNEFEHMYSCSLCLRTELYKDGKRFKPTPIGCDKDKIGSGNSEGELK
jgi:hypothetical protein